MGFPSILKNYRLYNDGNNYQGQVAEVVLPKIVHVMEPLRLGGMLGPVEADMGLEAMELEFTNAGLIKQVLRQMGTPTVDGCMLRFVGAYQSDDTGNVDQCEVVVRGRPKELDLGTAKAGEATEHKTKWPVSYFKLSINGRVEIEIDMLRAIYIVDGGDRYAQIRNALGG